MNYLRENHTESDAMRLSPALLSAFLALSAPAHAHFLELIPSADVLPTGGSVVLDLAFSHPFDGGPAMQMERPVAFGMILDGVAVDLTASLTEVVNGGVSGWTATVDLPAPGAALFHVTPAPYWEPAEGKFIIHHTKVLVDSWATGADWNRRAGLPVEIVPLTRPTGLWAGNSFAGVVTRNGAPVPFAEIEVEFINDGRIAAPNDAFVTQAIMADANGTFHYTMPFPGWWGFAALLEGSAPMLSPDGEPVPVEEGGLIWVHATAAEMR